MEKTYPDVGGVEGAISLDARSCGAELPQQHLHVAFALRVGRARTITHHLYVCVRWSDGFRHGLSPPHPKSIFPRDFCRMWG